MFIIRGIIGLVLTLSLAGFAAMNTDPIEVFISPLHDPVDFPLYLVALVSVAVYIGVVRLIDNIFYE